MANPWKKCIVLVTKDTPYKLYDLMATIDPTVSATWEDLKLQVDPLMGAAYVRIGNSDLAADNWGEKLVAGQAAQGTTRFNNCNTKDIWLMADVANCIIGVSGLHG